MNEELLSLIRDARFYIQAQLPEKGAKEHQEPLSPTPKQGPRPAQGISSHLSIEQALPANKMPFEASEKPKTQVDSQQKKAPSSLPPEKSQNPWKLNPMPLPPAEAPFFSSLKRYTEVHELFVPVHLIFIEQNAEEQLFLEGLAKAITRSYAPTSLIFSQDLSLQKTHYLLAPESFLQKHFADVKLYSPFISDRTHILPMADYSLYLNDREAKRILWQAIQKLFLS